MPTLFWFLRVLALCVLLVYAAMSALVWAVEPRITEFSEPVAVDLVASPETTGGLVADPAASPDQ